MKFEGLTTVSGTLFHPFQPQNSNGTDAASPLVTSFKFHSCGGRNWIAKNTSFRGKNEI
jgi:hypothetical protein